MFVDRCDVFSCVSSLASCSRFGHCFFCRFLFVSSKPGVPHSCLSCIFSSSSSSSFHSYRHENNYCSHRKYLDVVGCGVLSILVDLSLHLSNDSSLLVVSVEWLITTCWGHNLWSLQHWFRQFLAHFQDLHMFDLRFKPVWMYLQLEFFNWCMLHWSYHLCLLKRQIVIWNSFCFHWHCFWNCYTHEVSCSCLLVRGT
jgi:hypothetical protein